MNQLLRVTMRPAIQIIQFPSKAKKKTPRAVDGVIWAWTRRAAAVSEYTRIGHGRKSRSCARVKVPEVSGIAGVSKKNMWLSPVPNRVNLPHARAKRTAVYKKRLMSVQWLCKPFDDDRHADISTTSRSIHSFSSHYSALGRILNRIKKRKARLAF